VRHNASHRAVSLVRGKSQDERPLILLSRTPALGALWSSRRFRGFHPFCRVIQRTALLSAGSTKQARETGKTPSGITCWGSSFIDAL
jgi:hypothetical protein